jgi:hypothetical protein
MGKEEGDEMKRSEAEAVIDKCYQEFVNDWINTNLDNLDPFVSLPTRVLIALEKAGMLPPTFKGDADGKYWNVTDAVAHLNSTGPEWKPEEES